VQFTGRISAIALGATNDASLTGLTTNAATLHVVKLALPEGTELKFR
jgi:hypothetical protein